MSAFLSIKKIEFWRDLLAFLAILLIFNFIFSRFFINPENGIGHDYSSALPLYLDGYYWFKNNGIFNPPWFTPSFCAGQPFFADPQSLYYSPTQFLSFYLDPLIATYISLIGFASVGFWGMYYFCKHRLNCDSGPAILAAALWMFNGFSTHHHLVGHVGFLPVFIAPAVSNLLLSSTNSSDLGYRQICWRTVAAGILIAGCLHSGLGTIMIPFSLAVWALGTIAILKGHRSALFYGLAFSSGLFALAISASKIVAAISLMHEFPRSQYLLPGISGIPDVIKFTWNVIFFPEEDVYSSVIGMLINRNIGAGPHEMAFDITPIPAIIILVALAFAIPKLGWGILRMRWTQYTHISILILIASIPLAIIFYSPEWNSVLKSLPVLSSTSAPWRWLIALLPMLCAGTAIALHSLFNSQNAVRTVSLVLLALLLILKTTTPRTYYEEQSYDPKEILIAYRAAQAPGFKPEIKRIGTYADAEGNTAYTNHQNNLIAQGVSQAFCYNPLFGYGLENFAIGTLHPGDPLSVRKNELNLKNPACYVFPRANTCAPGDQFKDTPEDKKNARNLLQFQPWPFEKSQLQKIADTVTELSLLVILVLIAISSITRVYGLKNNKQ